jgi:hypothetical protein
MPVREREEVQEVLREVRKGISIQGVSSHQIPNIDNWVLIPGIYGRYQSSRF